MTKKSLESLRLYIRDSLHARKHVRDSARQAASILGQSRMYAETRRRSKDIVHLFVEEFSHSIIISGFQL